MSRRLSSVSMASADWRPCDRSTALTTDLLAAFTARPMPLTLGRFGPVDLLFAVFASRGLIAARGVEAFVAAALAFAVFVLVFRLAIFVIFIVPAAPRPPTTPNQRLSRWGSRCRMG